MDVEVPPTEEVPEICAGTVRAKSNKRDRRLYLVKFERKDLVSRLADANKIRHTSGLGWSVKTTILNIIGQYAHIHERKLAYHLLAGIKRILVAPSVTISD